VTSKDAASRARGSGHPFRRRRLELAEGGALVLANDGSIERVDAAGAVTERWVPTDPGWAAPAIRFGLVQRSKTVPPAGRRVRAPKVID
jgi:hypothetical protein